MFKPKLLSLLIATSLLTACSGSDDKDNTTTTPEPTPPTEYAHKVTGQVTYIGAIAGANVCVDLNQDLSCSEGEPSTTTGTDGKYQIDWKSETEKPNYYLLANWIDTAPSSARSALAMSSAAANTNATTGGMNIVALPDHAGHINALTNIEFSRYRKMIEADLTPQQVIEFRAKLKSLYATGFKQVEADLFSLSPEITLQPTFIDTLLLHDYLLNLTNERTVEILAAIEVLIAAFEAFENLILGYGFGTEAYLQTNPVAVTNKVESTLVSFGYMEAPVDDKAMNSTDWDTVFSSIFNPTGESHLLNIETVRNSHFIALSYGLDNDSLFGVVSGDAVVLFDNGSGEPNRTECWNEPMKKWINASRNDQGYLLKEPVIEGNKIKTVHAGTEIPVEMNFHKYQNTAADWQDLLANLPSDLKLASLSWPSQIYRIDIKQSADVICREEDPVTYETGVETASELSSSLIVKLLWPYSYPESYIEDSPHKFTILDSFGQPEHQYEWDISTSPNGGKLLTITEIEADPITSKTIQAHYYLVTANLLTEADLFKALDTAENKQLYNFTYDSSFSNTLRNHFKSLAK
ncbi:hypothetical protein CBX96_10125 [Shewanella sp. BC20]|uniref:hypothetical protein n=1 Tax=Shewanella sp. BC20 TaxID=2004459 RepID=UPI000D64445D|nr:hypothetical protein [Shewanella sp. BC20]PWF63483.1 hypothetical protein CBX96_10125 [Shewanella sp. BC20]